MKDKGHELLAASPVVRYANRNIMTEEIAELNSLGYSCSIFNCINWQVEADFHKDVAIALEFPHYYGRNLDAFKDCLFGVTTRSAAGVALAFYEWDNFAQAVPEDSWKILDVIAFVSRRLLVERFRFFALLHAPDTPFYSRRIGGNCIAKAHRERIEYGRTALLNLKSKKTDDETDAIHD